MRHVFAIHKLRVLFVLLDSVTMTVSTAATDHELGGASSSKKGKHEKTKRKTKQANNNKK